MTAIIVHRMARGARYYTREYERVLQVFAPAVSASLPFLALASQIAEKLAENGHADLNDPSDVGINGYRLILCDRHVVKGFDTRIKPGLMEPLK